jgi:hypothetical protein
LRADDRPAGAGEQLVGVERLDDVVVGADEESHRPVDRLDSVRGDEEDRQLLAEVVAELVAELEAADARQRHGEENERRPLRARSRERLLPAGSFDRGEAGAREQLRDESSRLLVVVDDQDRAVLDCRSGFLLPRTEL